MHHTKSVESQGCAVFVVCYYRGKHLGTRRFAIYTMLAKKAARCFRQRMQKLEHSNILSQISQLSNIGNSQEDLTTAMDNEEVQKKT